MDVKESRIAEIMNELDCDHDVAECMFYDEISDKYQTDDTDVAETMFYADSQDENEQKSFMQEE